MTAQKSRRRYGLFWGLLSHENEKNDMEKRAIENIKSNPKHFFAYARKKLKTSKIGPFRINGEIFNTLDDI